MTQQQEYKEELWDKYCMQGDTENPDRMFYEQFCLAVEEIIQIVEDQTNGHNCTSVCNNTKDCPLCEHGVHEEIGCEICDITSEDKE